MVTSVYSMSSVCPCCGKQICPVGLGGAAIIGGFLVLLGKSILKFKELLIRLFKDRLVSR